MLFIAFETDDLKVSSKYVKEFYCQISLHGQFAIDL